MVRKTKAFYANIARTGSKALLNRFLNLRERKQLLRAGVKPKVHYYLMLDIFQRFVRETGGRFKRKETARGIGLIYSWMRAFDDLAERRVRERSLFALKDLNQDKQVSGQVSRFVSFVKSLKLDRKTKRQIISAFSEMRKFAFKKYLVEMEMGYFPNPEKVIEWKEGTTGKAFELTGKIIALVNGLSEKEAGQAGKALKNWALSAQVADDVRDLHIDYGKNQNFVVSFLTRHPEERKAVESALRNKRVSLKWLEQRAPKTMKEIRSLFNKYLDGITTASQSNAFKFLQELERTFFNSRIMMKHYR